MTPSAENDAGCICPSDICLGTDSDSGMRVECAACLALDPELPCLRDEDEQEWTVEGFMAECDRVTDNPPPAPDGLELVECEARPRHWPSYVAHVEGMYPAPCMYCVSADQSRTIAEERCRREHRRWKSWRIWRRLASWLYVVGITSSGGGVSMGRCEFCGTTRQHSAPHWKGRRPYLLGKPHEWWSCLRRGHIYSPLEGRTFHLCSVCAPCSTCGSTDPMHQDSIDCPRPISYRDRS